MKTSDLDRAEAIILEATEFVQDVASKHGIAATARTVGASVSGLRAVYQEQQGPKIDRILAWARILLTTTPERLPSGRPPRAVK